MSANINKNFTINIVTLLAIIFISGTVGFIFGRVANTLSLKDLENEDVNSQRIQNLKDTIRSQEATPQVNNREEKNPSKWQIFSIEDFILLLPFDWERENNRLGSKNIKQYGILYTVSPLEKITDSVQRSNLEQGQLREYEQMRYMQNCEQSGEGPCGTLGQFKIIETNGLVGLEYIITMPDIILPENRGLSDQIIRVYVQNEKLYRFSSEFTHKDKKTGNLKPTPFENFRMIMDTLRLN